MGKTYRRAKDEWDDRNRIKKSDAKKLKPVVVKPVETPWPWIANDRVAEDEDRARRAFTKT